MMCYFLIAIPTRVILSSAYSTTLCVKINNSHGKDFASHRGVRQRDPFSPFLFNMVAENLSKMIFQAQGAGLIVGLVPHLIPQGIAILQYADDAILLSSAFKTSSVFV